jgi:uncharacterized protein YktB (UPF0637 family)
MIKAIAFAHKKQNGYQSKAHFNANLYSHYNRNFVQFSIMNLKNEAIFDFYLKTVSDQLNVKDNIRYLIAHGHTSINFPKRVSQKSKNLTLKLSSFGSNPSKKNRMNQIMDEFEHKS